MATGRIGRRDSGTVRSAWFGILNFHRRCLLHRRFAVKGFELAEVDALDVSSDAAFGETQRHPRLEVFDHARLYFGMFEQIVIQSVGPGCHQRLEPGRTVRILLLQIDGIDEEPLPQILPDLRLAFGLGGKAHRSQIVGFDAVEVVFALDINHAEDGVGVGLSADVRDAPVVTNDRDIAGVHCGEGGDCEGENLSKD